MSMLNTTRPYYLDGENVKCFKKNYKRQNQWKIEKIANICTIEEVEMRCNLISESESWFPFINRLLSSASFLLSRVNVLL